MRRREAAIMQHEELVAEVRRRYAAVADRPEGKFPYPVGHESCA